MSGSLVHVILKIKNKIKNIIKVGSKTIQKKG